MRVLVVDDEAPLRAFLGPLLEREGFTADCVATGAEALAAITDARPDLVLLDVNLPDLSGLDVCRAIRRLPGYLPVILLTGLDSRDDELAGFAALADEYVTKPFVPEALVARVRAILRLAGNGQRRVVRLGDIEVDLDVREARRDGRDVGLQPKEFDLLAFLVEHPGQVFGQSQLLDHIWGPEYDGDPHTIVVRMSRLRSLVEPNPNRPRYLLTRPGVGYYLKLEDAS